ncbi:MAG TPA: iron-sulfur cluster repair di-iron protein [Humisphaera sp.]
MQLLTRTLSAEATESLLDRTVGDLVVERPGRARVFERLGIDFCCGGRKRLRQACRDRRVDPYDAVLRLEIDDERVRPADPAAEPDWSTAPLADLADHIERAHHNYLRAELPRLDRLTAKVVHAHGGRRPELAALRDAVLALREELEPHMEKEERVFFPLCRALEAADRDGGEVPRSPCGTSAAGPVDVLTHEHDAAGDLLARIRQLADDFVPPPDACNTYRAMLDALAGLEADMHQHVHKENNILFPRAVALEAAVRGRAG